MTVVANIIKLFENEGFAVCASSDSEDGIEKVALYAAHGEWKHMALQKMDGKWTSKLGPLEDIEHDSPESLAGGEFGDIVCLLMRVRR